MCDRRGGWVVEWGVGWVMAVDVSLSLSLSSVSFMSCLGSMGAVGVARVGIVVSTCKILIFLIKKHTFFGDGHDGPSPPLSSSFPLSLSSLSSSSVVVRSLHAVTVVALVCRCGGGRSRSRSGFHGSPIWQPAPAPVTLTRNPHG